MRETFEEACGHQASRSSSGSDLKQRLAMSGKCRKHGQSRPILWKNLVWHVPPTHIIHNRFDTGPTHDLALQLCSTPATEPRQDLRVETLCAELRCCRVVPGTVACCRFTRTLLAKAAKWLWHVVTYCENRLKSDWNSLHSWLAGCGTEHHWALGTISVMLRLAYMWWSAAKHLGSEDSPEHSPETINQHLKVWGHGHQDAPGALSNSWHLSSNIQLQNKTEHLLREYVKWRSWNHIEAVGRQVISCSSELLKNNSIWHWMLKKVPDHVWKGQPCQRSIGNRVACHASWKGSAVSYFPMHIPTCGSSS